MKCYVSWNFKNVPLTVPTYHQQWMCYNLVVRPGQETSGFLYPGDEISFGMYGNLHICISVMSRVDNQLLVTFIAQ